MEFLKGLPLGARMNQPPSLTLDDKLNVVAQLCHGLSYAHEQGVVHRDVKPDNVFILEDGSVKLLDFGIAKLTTSTLTRQGDVLGSASYMSPEQVSGSESVDGRADIFSVGVLLYELLSGRRPFEGTSPTAIIVKILNEHPTPIESITTGLPSDVVAIVMRALQKDPADRYQTADALGRDLQTVRKELHPSLSRGDLDETRLAGTEMMKVLHDYQRGRSGAGLDTALGLAPTMAPGAGYTPARPASAVGASSPAISANPTIAAVPAPDKRWLVPALASALVAVLGVGGFMFYATRRPSNDASTTAVTDAAATGRASTPAPTAPAPIRPRLNHLWQQIQPQPWPHRSSSRRLLPRRRSRCRRPIPPSRRWAALLRLRLEPGPHRRRRRRPSRFQIQPLRAPQIRRRPPRKPPRPTRRLPDRQGRSMSISSIRFLTVQLKCKSTAGDAGARSSGSVRTSAACRV